MHDNNILVDKDVNLKLNMLESQGKTATLVAVNNKIAGIIALADTIKDSALLHNPLGF